jgi:hypothetical protein
MENQNENQGHTWFEKENQKENQNEIQIENQDFNDCIRSQ